jgi:geranylgeranyl diphosphate synthase type II
MKPVLAAALDEYVPVIDSYLAELKFADAVIDRFAAPLGRAMHYSLNAGGKRLRPVLTIMGYRLLADDWQRTLPVGGAYELVHT